MEKPAANFLLASSSLEGKKVAFLQGSANFGLTFEEKQFLAAHPAIKLFRSLNELLALSPSTEAFDVVLVGKGYEFPRINADAKAHFFQVILTALVPGGKLQFLSSTVDTADLLLGGFINTSQQQQTLTCEKPSYKPALLLPKAKKPAVAVVEELIDEDALLEDAEDCEIGSSVDADITVTKRACKNCTCGLKEAQVVLDVAEDSALAAPPASGCGGCARGDAFRCGGCPYLGTPAFTPGTKPEILVKDDGSKTLVQIDLGGADF